MEFWNGKCQLWPFSHQFMGGIFHYVPVEWNHETKDDADFAHLLNRLRTGNHTSNDIDVLKSRVIDSENTDIQSMPHLFVTNDAVDHHNAGIFLNSPMNKKVEISSIDVAVGDVSKTVKTRFLQRVPKHHTKTMGLMGKLPVALNQHVDISINVNVSDGLTNGATGVVKFIDYRVPNSERCSIIWIRFDCQTVGQNTRSKYSSLYKSGIAKTWTPVFEISRQFSVGKNRDCFVLRRQFPIPPSGAKTVHKSQGDTMSNAVVNLGSNRRQAHIHYVALSWVQNLQGLHVLDLCDKKICASSAVQGEMGRLTTRPFRSCMPKMELSEANQHSSVIKALFFNIRSLHAHYLDLKHDQCCLQADVIALSETRLTKTDPDTFYALNGYQLYLFESRQLDLHGVLWLPQYGYFRNSQRTGTLGISLWCMGQDGLVPQASIFCNKWELFVIIAFLWFP